MGLDLVAQATFFPASGKAEAELKFKFCLSYRASSRPTRTMQKDPISEVLQKGLGLWLTFGIVTQQSNKRQTNRNLTKENAEA